MGCVHTRTARWHNAVGFAAVVILVSPGHAQDAGTLFHRGAKLQQAGDLDGARQAYERALATEPRRVEVLANLGQVYLRLGRREHAAESLRRALEVRPDLATVRLTLGTLLFELNDFAGAAEQASELVKQQPDNVKAFQLLGMSLLKLGRMGEGISTLEKALDQNPGQRSIAYTLATAYIRSDDLAAAERLLETSLRGETSAEVHMIRGAVHKSRQRYIEAIEELEAARAMNPRLELAHELLGGTYLLVGDFERAKKTYESVLTTDPDNHWANVNLGWIHIRHREYDKAAPYVRTAYRLRPDDIEVLHMMGQIEQVEGKYEEARVKLERVAAARPEDKSVHVLLSRIYLKLGRRDDFNREKEIIQRLSDEEQRLKLDEMPGPAPGGQAPSSGGPQAPASSLPRPR